MPQSPWQGAAVTRKKAALDFPRFKLDSFDEKCIILPFRYAVAAGVLSASGRQDCTAAQIEHSAAGVQFIHTPPSPTSYAFANRSNATAMTVTTSTVNVGLQFNRRFTMTTGGTPSINIKGFLALAEQRPGAAVATADRNIVNGSLATADVGGSKTLSERKSHPALAMVEDLTVFSIRFKVDAGGNPTSTTAFGWPNFFASKSSTGVYAVTLGVELPTNTICVPACDSRGVDVTAISGNSVTVNTYNVAAAADPTNGSEIVLLFFCAGRVGNLQMGQNNGTSRPRIPQGGRSYRVSSFVKDAVFLPIVLSINGSGDIQASGSTIPDGVKVLRSGTTYAVECGAGLAAFASAAFQPATAAVGLPVDYTNFPTQGRIQFTGTLASTTVYGWILASRTKVQ